MKQLLKMPNDTGEEGDRIKACLLSGKLAEYPQLLNQLLAKAGLLITSPSVSSETEVTSSVTTRHSVKSVNPSTSSSAASSQWASADDETDFKEHVHQATQVSSYTDSREVRFLLLRRSSAPGQTNKALRLFWLLCGNFLPNK